MSHFAVRFLEKSSHPFSCLTDESPCLSICTLKGIVTSFQQKNGKKQFFYCSCNLSGIKIYINVVTSSKKKIKKNDEIFENLGGTHFVPL